MELRKLSERTGGFRMMQIAMLVVVASLLFIAPQRAEANFNNYKNDYCYNCHTVGATTGTNANLDVRLAVGGTDYGSLTNAAGVYSSASIDVVQGTTVEVDLYQRNVRGTGDTTLGYYVVTPAAPTNQVDWLLSAGTAGTAPTGWPSIAWEPDTGGSGWNNTLFDDGAKPTSQVLYNVWIQQYGGGTKTEGDLGGTDFRIAIPAAASGPYVLTVYGAGHEDGGGRNGVQININLNVTTGGGDSTAPTANNDVAVSPESGTFVPADFTVTGTFTDAESAVSACEYTIDGTNWFAVDNITGTNPYTCTKAITGQADTTALTINMRATSSGGGPTASTAINRTVDAAAPTTSDNVPAGWQTSNVTVTLTPADAGSGVASTSYCVDQANSCAPGTAYAAPFLVSTEGNNFVRYSSTDNLGNVQTVVSKTLDLDKTAPTDGALTPTPGNTQIQLDWTVATDATSGLASPAYTVSMATGTTTPPADCSANIIYTGNLLTHTETGLTNGVDYAFRVCASDNAGLTSTGTTATAQPSAGNTVPNVPTTLAQYLLDGTTPIALSGYTTEGSVVFEADISDPDGGDTVKLQIDTDSNGTSDCESVLSANPSTNVQVTCVLADGAYDWQARTVDNNGATSAWAAFNAATPDLTKDASAPVDGALTATAGDTEIVLTWTAATDAHSGLASPAYTVSMASGTTTPPVDCSANVIFTGDTLTHTETGLTNGVDYAFRVCADNNAGLTSTGSTDTVQPAAGCTPAQPTVSLAPAAQTIPNDGGLVVYTVTVTNNDLACADATFSLSANDTNGTEFYSSVLSKTSMTIASGAFDTATVTVQSIPGNDAVTNGTTVTATDSPTHDPPVVSAAVTTTVTFGGGCVGTGTNSNATAGGTLLTGR